MKSSVFAAVLALSLDATAPANASQIVITFEDIAPGEINDGYGGVSGWNAAGNVVINDYNEGVGKAYFYGQEGELRFDNGPVIFAGAFYKSYAADPSAATPGFSLYYHDQLVFETLDPHYPLSLEWLPSGYAGLVDKIFIHGGGEGYAIDNLTYTMAAVPVPGAALLFASVLTGFSLSASRRKAG